MASHMVLFVIDDLKQRGVSGDMHLVLTESQPSVST
jgi:hypothetical protein